MQQAGPILVYSIYPSDIPRFERLLAQALPNTSIHCACSPEQAAPYLGEARILYGWGFPREILSQMPNLRWVQKMGAGVDEIVEGWPEPVLLTRTAGELIAPRMAEYVLGAILDRVLRFDIARTQQERQQWQFFEIGSIRNITIGIAGVGEIGSIVARTLRRLGARVLGWRRSGLSSSAVDELFAGFGALPRFLGACDVVVVVLPLTKDTKGLFGANLFAHCRPGAHLINIGRGGLIDEAALVAALDARHIGHATLDVFAAEPLPPRHPFWDNPHITVTPHVCGPLVPEDVVPHFLTNYAAFANGRPMQNIIDVERQY
jgi:phosphoglycerate dehydrogenase-like enzyme